jgi:serpin B
VITNAIYFKGSWLSEFKKELSKHDHFYTSATQKKMIPFMHQSSEFRYAASEELQLLEMSYRGNELAMDIILPKTGIDLAKIEKKNEDPHDQ